jgi:hypothetical protein
MYRLILYLYIYLYVYINTYKHICVHHFYLTQVGMRMWDAGAEIHLNSSCTYLIFAVLISKQTLQSIKKFKDIG